MAIKFFKDWLVQKSNTYLIDGVPKVLTRDFGTVYQEGDKDKADYFNEIQKNCIYSVNATRVIEGVLEIYDISVTGSETFPLFNTQLLINFNETNTKVDPVLRWNGKTYQIRKNTKFTNLSFVIGEIQKTNLVVLDQINSLALVSEFRDYERFDEVNVVGDNGGQDVVIPQSLPIGYEKVIRKTGTTGQVKIKCADTNEKFTTGLLTQISLNSDGDFWKIKKVSNTRWDLLEGFEKGVNSDGSYIKNSNCKMNCWTRILSTGNTSDAGVYISSNISWTFPGSSYISKPRVRYDIEYSTTFAWPRYVGRLSNSDYNNTSIGGIVITYLVPSATVQTQINLSSEGDWY